MVCCHLDGSNAQSGSAASLFHKKVLCVRGQLTAISGRGGSKIETKPTNTHLCSSSVRATPRQRRPLSTNTNVSQFSWLKFPQDATAHSKLLYRSASSCTAIDTFCSSSALNSHIGSTTCGAPFMHLNTLPSGPRIVACVRLLIGSNGTKSSSSNFCPTPERAQFCGSSS